MVQVKILVAGASGFLGTALCSELAEAGHDVHRLVRREPTGDDEHRWDPDADDVDGDLVATMDAVVNLAGAPIAHWPWTASWRQNILQSRVRTTSTLARAVAVAPDPPALVVASGMTIHGSDRGAEWLDESSSQGRGFLADVVRAWEAAADPARDAGARVVHLRTGVVADRRGGALKLMLPAFRLGVGARLGSGRQYFSVISRRDWVAAARFLVEHNDCAGPFNLVGLDPPTNEAFTRVLASRVRRPALLVVPALPVRLVLGELSGELLGSLRMRPTRLVEAGFEHRDRVFEDVLDAALTA
jgi:uncharacterized protein (TIGR01777 family)